MYQELVAEFGGERISVLAEDAYYRNQDHLSMDQRVLTNYDHPAAFEHELLAQHLQSQLQHICTEPLVLQTVVQPVQDQSAAAALQQLELSLLQAKTQPSSQHAAYSRVWY